MTSAASPGEPPAEPARWQAPPVRAEALLVTWAMMLLGHGLVGVLAVVALAGGSRDHSGTALAAFWTMALLGLAGGAVAWHGVRVTGAVRRAERAGQVPAPPAPAPLALAVGIALLGIGVTVIVIAMWGAGGVLPAAGGELVFVPLAVRTQRYLDDARAAAPPG